MNLRPRRLLRFASTFLLIVSAETCFSQGDIRIELGNLREHRSTGKEPSYVIAELKITGEDGKAAKLARATVTKCTDDTGSDLVSPTIANNGFNSLGGGAGSMRQTAAWLKSPARSATKIKELGGEVSLFVPSRDPGATVTVSEFQTQIGRRIPSPALTAAGIDVVPLSSEQYQQICDAKAKEAEQKAKAQKLPADFIAGVAETSNKLTRKLLEPGGVPIRISDPSHNLIYVEFQTADGQKIRDSKSSFPDKDARIVIYHFKEGLPVSSVLVLSIASPAAMVSAPFQFYDIALP